MVYAWRKPLGHVQCLGRCRRCNLGRGQSDYIGAGEWLSETPGISSSPSPIV